MFRKNTTMILSSIFALMVVAISTIGHAELKYSSASGFDEGQLCRSAAQDAVRKCEYGGNPNPSICDCRCSDGSSVSGSGCYPATTVCSAAASCNSNPNSEGSKSSDIRNVRFMSYCEKKIDYDMAIYPTEKDMGFPLSLSWKGAKGIGFGELVAIKMANGIPMYYGEDSEKYSTIFGEKVSSKKNIQHNSDYYMYFRILSGYNVDGSKVPSGNGVKRGPSKKPSKSSQFSSAVFTIDGKDVSLIGLEVPNKDFGESTYGFGRFSITISAFEGISTVKFNCK